MRWQQILSEYNISFEYVRGGENTFADGLSRRPDLRLMLVSAVAYIDHLLKEMKDGCRHIVEAKRLVRKDRAATPSTRTPYRILYGLLYHVADGKNRVFFFLTTSNCVAHDRSIPRFVCFWSFRLA